MSGTVAVHLPRVVVERLRLEAERQGINLEEYMLELLLRDLDPRDRARGYIEAALELLEDARRELEKGGVRQAAEKLWGAAALAVKAYAAWREGRRLTSHGELWEYTRTLRRDLGRWVHTAWMAAVSMHVCFYEGWCAREHVEDALAEVERLVRTVRGKVGAEG